MKEQHTLAGCLDLTIHHCGSHSSRGCTCGAGGCLSGDLEKGAAVARNQDGWLIRG